MADYLEELQRTEGLTYNMVDVRGVPQNPTFDVAVFSRLIDDFVTKDGDVFISTYVKAGTTWTQQIVHALLSDAGFPQVGAKYGETVPWLEAAVASEFLGPREAPGWDIARIDAAPAPRYFKTHATVEHLPRGHADIKVIYVARNPKDTCVSLFHHAQSKPEFAYNGDFETFFNIFLAGRAENGDWFEHCAAWHLACRARPDTHLFLQYEDMVDDPAAAVTSINAFLGRPELGAEALQRLLQQSSMAHMRVHACIGLNHLRKGGYGGWRATFSVEQSELFDEVYVLKMAPLQEELQDKGELPLTFNFGPNARGEACIM